MTLTSLLTNSESSEHEYIGDNEAPTEHNAVAPMEQIRNEAQAGQVYESQVVQQADYVFDGP